MAATTSTGIELGELSLEDGAVVRSRSSSHVRPDPAIPPPDHGKGAYMVLAGCALVQAPIWGYSLAFGIFQEFYTKQGPAIGLDDASEGAVASIGTTQTGLMYLLMPLTSIVLTRYPSLRSWSCWAGLVLTLVSLVWSAFVTTIAQLIATQGVLYALGCGLLFSPTSLYMDEWFVERKGLAYGTMWSSKALVGVVMPFLMSALLDRVGLRAALLAWAAASTIMTIPLLVLIKPRIPLSDTTSSSSAAGRRPALSFGFLRHPLFWMLQTGNVVQSFGYRMPSTYLAEYASSIGLSHITGPVVLAIFSFASVPGSLIHGLLGDRLSASTNILISSVGSAASVFLLWGFSLQAGVLFTFAILYGFFAGGFSATWSGILNEMRGLGRRERDDGENAGDRGDVDTGLVFGMLMGGRGLGFMLSGPLSGVLLSLPANAAMGTDISTYSSQYGPMIVCTGLTAILGAWGCLWGVGQRCRRVTLRLGW
ncbi:MFS general substrate transporter [Thozetella sp. PMI_491]|nr:MFS general substrate transporter [Thozetella sp. PMI_491]